MIIRCYYISGYVLGAPDKQTTREFGWFLWMEEKIALLRKAMARR